MSGKIPNLPENTEELLIVSVTPQNVERGVLWFTENLNAIKNAGTSNPPAVSERFDSTHRESNPWWRENSIFIEPDRAMKPSEFSRILIDFGYERAQLVRGRGLFAPRGGIVEVWPINTEKPYLIEFAGNTIGSIQERPESEESVAPKIVRSNAEIEKLPLGSFVVHTDHGIGILRGVIDKSISNAHDPMGEVADNRCHSRESGNPELIGSGFSVPPTQMLRRTGKLGMTYFYFTSLSPAPLRVA